MAELLSSMLNGSSHLGVERRPNHKFKIRDVALFVPKKIILFDEDGAPIIFNRASASGRIIPRLVSFNTRRGASFTKRFFKDANIDIGPLICHEKCFKAYTISKHMQGNVPRSPVCINFRKINRPGLAKKEEK